MGKLQFATLENHKDIMKVFRKHKNFLSHVRSDFIYQKILRKEVIFQDGVVITFTKYKKYKTIGDVIVPAGTWAIKQIASLNEGQGYARKVLSEFIKYSTSMNLYLSVRNDNERALNFYEKFGFKTVGKNSWNEGEIKGKVMRYSKV